MKRELTLSITALVLTLLASLEAVLVSSTAAVQELLTHAILAVIVPIGLEVTASTLALFHEAKLCRKES